MKRWIKKCT